MMEVYRGLPEGTQAELIDATIYISTSRVRAHQRTVAILSSRMILYAEEKEIGEVYTAPFDVYLDEHANAVQPDIVFVSAAKLSIIDRYIYGVPDLIVEVLSDGNEDHDRIKKKLYTSGSVFLNIGLLMLLQKMLPATSIKMVNMTRLLPAQVKSHHEC